MSKPKTPAEKQQQEIAKLTSRMSDLACLGNLFIGCAALGTILALVLGVAAAVWLISKI